MSVSVIAPQTVFDASKFAYAQATRMGDLIFVAGQVSLDADGNLVGKDDVRTQTEQVFANLREILRAAGSGLDCVGKVTVFTTKLEYRPIIHEIRTRMFQGTGILPASTLAVVTSLANPDWLVEIEAIAMARDGSRG